MNANVFLIENVFVSTEKCSEINCLTNVSLMSEIWGEGRIFVEKKNPKA